VQRDPSTGALDDQVGTAWHTIGWWITMAEISRLPGPVADLWEWQLDGSCRTADPRLFFHPEGERGPARRDRDAAAKAVCASCPVLQQCRRHALTVREPYGVWGGMTEDERNALYLSERDQGLSVAS
jgi:WhiB family transcriptional regulator, redox-sensing transcriptional regulator